MAIACVASGIAGACLFAAGAAFGARMAWRTRVGLPPVHVRTAGTRVVDPEAELPRNGTDDGRQPERMRDLL